MLEKIAVLVLLYTVMLAYDGPKLKRKSLRERAAYGVIVLAAVYLSIDYVWETDWPNLNELVDLVLSEPAKRIVKSVKVSP
ncbi:hypothetical protein L1N85_05870 [Paenibacillus alkaliterrae]|uniref:hypothetical protein n=1 Tax=Paenibacillus alkaliterrae TaxID=320909 RepID=UPI001F241C05|nr:hypothetical protein [Paenibacillus alkaliterrae]MCF2937955.1 hypothetical protein [Paenibacillus alkaliterrae]